MTVEEFRATRTWCADLGKHFADARWDDEPLPAQGWLYLDQLYIEQRPAAGWSNPGVAQGEWLLIIANCGWIEDDLAALEQKLYEFAVSEGYCGQ